MADPKQDDGIYITKKMCGCLTTAVVASSPRAANEVSKAIRRGETVQHINRGELPDIDDWFCSEHPRKDGAFS